MPPGTLFVGNKMLQTILAIKGKMGQTYVDGQRVPTTTVLANPCIVTHIKTQEKDGYWAVQLGTHARKIKNITKPLLGHLKGAIKKQKMAPSYLTEVKLENEPQGIEIGMEITIAEVLSPGDTVDVTGITKGKGFAGGVKRWGFSGGPRTHGQSDRERAPGSIGQGTSPGRVRKGKRMAGRMGTQRKVAKNLKVLSTGGESNEVVLSGLVPGAIGGMLTIKKVKGVQG